MDNLKGMAWMTLAMLAFALTDMVLVFATRELPLGQVLFLFGTGGAVLFGIWARLQGHRWVSPVLLMRPVMLRNGAEILATGAFTTALSLIPLSTLSAVIQANPLLVTLGAALFLGERVGWRRWAAIGVGLVGVLVIIRPGAQSFDPNILFAVAAAIGLSLRDLATRPVPRHVPTTLLASYSFASVGVAGGLVMPVSGGWVAPSPAMTLIIPVGVLTGMLAYFAITAAMRVGEIAVVTPFRYTRLVFAFVTAALVFDETIDAPTVLGVAIVVATGLYTFWRERRAAG
ncbi:EamA family transporter [Rhodobacterales bacterium HKCCSP123]|nr:EamA family transporter [Rhodobacterales bacterium HKCCSP123]